MNECQKEKSPVQVFEMTLSYDRKRMDVMMPEGKRTFVLEPQKSNKPNVRCCTNPFFGCKEEDGCSASACGVNMFIALTLPIQACCWCAKSVLTCVCAPCLACAYLNALTWNHLKTRTLISRIHRWNDFFVVCILASRSRLCKTLRN